jgi:hypothetical protein
VEQVDSAAPVTISISILSAARKRRSSPNQKRKNGEGFTQLETWLGDYDVLFLRRNNADPMVALSCCTSAWNFREQRGLNWKDRVTGGSEARASRAIGGRYRISFNPGGYKNWRDEIVEPFYEIEYRRSHRREWNETVGISATLVEAKRKAEADNDERIRELQSDEETDAA